MMNSSQILRVYNQTNNSLRFILQNMRRWSNIHHRKNLVFIKLESNKQYSHEYSFFFSRDLMKFLRVIVLGIKKRKVTKSKLNEFQTYIFLPLEFYHIFFFFFKADFFTLHLVNIVCENKRLKCHFFITGNRKKF